LNEVLEKIIDIKKLQNHSWDFQNDIDKYFLEFKNLLAEKYVFSNVVSHGGFDFLLAKVLYPNSMIRNSEITFKKTFSKIKIDFYTNTISEEYIFNYKSKREINYRKTIERYKNSHDYRCNTQILFALISNHFVFFVLTKIYFRIGGQGSENSFSIPVSEILQKNYDKYKTAFVFISYLFSRFCNIDVNRIFRKQGESKYKYGLDVTFSINDFLNQREQDEKTQKIIDNYIKYKQIQ